MEYDSRMQVGALGTSSATSCEPSLQRHSTGKCLQTNFHVVAIHETCALEILGGVVAAAEE